MTFEKTPNQAKTSNRDRVLDAAERLLAKDLPSFSMRELATEAAVSFATPFNLFGSKAAIMLALSSRRIAAMHEELARSAVPSTASVVSRVLIAVDIAVGVMLSDASVNRAVMGAISTPAEFAGDVSLRSGNLWAVALGVGHDFPSQTRTLALTVLPHQLAVAFRGVLSFWTAGEIADSALLHQARSSAATVLLGFVSVGQRAELLDHLRKQ